MAQPMSPGERRILFITCLGHFLSHFNMLTFPALLLPLAGRLGLTLPQTIVLSFWMYLLFGLTALPWGLVADRIGAKGLLFLFFLGAGLSCLAAAVWIDSPVGLTLCLAGLGIFSGIYHPVGLGLISKNIRRMPVALGYHGVFGNLGLASAPLLAGLFNYWWGLRAAFLALAGFNLIGVGLAWLISVEKTTDRQIEATGQEGRINRFVILLVAMMLGGLVYRGATVIIPAHLELNSPALIEAVKSLWPAGSSPNLVATALASLVFGIGILGQYIGGLAGERFEARWSYLVFHAATIPAVIFMGLASNLPLVTWAAVYFFFLFGVQPIENSLVAYLSPPAFRHSAYGAKFVMTFGVGALAVILVGWVDGHWGLAAVFPALALISTALVATILLLMRKTPPLWALAAQKRP